MDRGKPNYSNNYNSNNSENSFDFSRIKNGYTDDQGNMKEEFFLNTGEKLAKYLGEKEEVTNKWGKPEYIAGLSASQLRQFFGEVKALQSKMGKNGEDFAKVYPFVLMLKSKAAYKEDTKNIPKKFREFIDINIELIKKSNKEGKGFETFNNFALFYEVVIGFFKGATK
ncbi:MAG: type III-A CRISPR-associated protein Csm2 [Leptotrichiaceae bacterium]|nr:type III-A CRISPR-associated protein Csm2 [Leptotrichiaceae bacterium]